MSEKSTESVEQKYAHEAKRWCSGDGEWTDWQPCSEQQAKEYRKDETFKVRPKKT